MKPMLVVDVSRWQADSNGKSLVDWAKLAAGKVVGAVVKLSQGDYLADKATLSHTNGAVEVGMWVEAYHWLDPGIDAKKQVEFVIKLVKEKGPFRRVWIDVEQYWKSWNEFYAKSITQKYDPQVISKAAKDMITGLQAAGINTGIYTRKSFIDYLAKPMEEWIAGVPLWLAYYPWSGTRVTTTWEALAKDYIEPLTFAPKMPGTAPAEHLYMWQMSGDKFILPGCSTPLDINHVFVIPAVIEPDPHAVLVSAVKKLEAETSLILATLTDITETMDKESATLKQCYKEVDQLQGIARTHGWDV